MRITHDHSRHTASIPHRHSDASIDYWGEVFRACHLDGEGICFERFLQDPHGILHAFGMDDAPEIMEAGFLPLLPKQARLRAQLDRQPAYCETVLGQWVMLQRKTFVQDWQGMAA